MKSECSKIQMSDETRHKMENIFKKLELECNKIYIKQAGQLGIYFYEKTAGNYHDENLKEKLIKLIINSACGI